MRIKIILLGALFLIATASLSCTQEGLGEHQRQTAVLTREQAFARAQAQIPQPIPQNFLARKMLAKYVERQDVPDHPFYVYILGQTGNIVGYYVAQAAPVNVCAFLSSTEKISHETSPGLLITAPSLDGIFYGGSGASSGCDGWFIFDAATDALVIVYGSNMFVADQPLRLEAKPITINALPSGKPKPDPAQ